ncbi:hypothetical protein EV44_g3543 [Erysiphe necator]|uniref:Uncharacterized protein n=1 Tax=Uncinula necator TaxID=52586 RepID=A0A0B1PCK8_UNCNE|nr:hypothetical protein EV44_g3543 [Erysiphe necator]
MEEYLNTTKRLNDDLSAKYIKLPKQVVVAWVLSNLTPKYEVIVISIMQSLQINIDSYSVESFFSNLLDESKRQKCNEDNNEQALAVQAKPPSIIGTNSAPTTNQTTQINSDVVMDPNPKADEIGSDSTQTVETSNNVAKSLNATNNNYTRPAIKIAKSQPSIPIDDADDLDELALMVNINNKPKIYKEVLATLLHPD